MGGDDKSKTGKESALYLFGFGVLLDRIIISTYEYHISDS